MLVLSAAGRDCAQPGNVADILIQKLKDIYYHPGFMVTRDFLPPAGLDLRQELRNSSNMMALQTREENCNNILERNGEGLRPELNQISSCPWIVKLDVNPDRIPSSIPEVDCTCDQCVYYDDECSLTRRRPCYTYRGRCEKMFTSKVVILRHCNETNGVYEYKSGLFPVAVGCTCTREIMRHSKAINMNLD